MKVSEDSVASLYPIFLMMRSLLCCSVPPSSFIDMSILLSMNLLNTFQATISLKFISLYNEAICKSIQEPCLVTPLELAKTDPLDPKTESKKRRTSPMSTKTSWV